jgi:hypothetical protein
MLDSLPSPFVFFTCWILGGVTHLLQGSTARRGHQKYVHMNDSQQKIGMNTYAPTPVIQASGGMVDHQHVKSVDMLVINYHEKASSIDKLWSQFEHDQRPMTPSARRADKKISDCHIGKRTNPPFPGCHACLL